jgi:hypothetical protein
MLLTANLFTMLHPLNETLSSAAPVAEQTVRTHTRAEIVPFLCASESSVRPTILFKP